MDSWCDQFLDKQHPLTLLPLPLEEDSAA